MKREQTECSKKFAVKLQMLVNHPEESIQHSAHNESLKSRTMYVTFEIITYTSLRTSDNMAVNVTFVIVSCYGLLLTVHMDVTLMTKIEH
jgi:RNase P/RNase MRP subunit POP5